ncbi:MAG: hypothetical protein IH589_15065 [Anaerolineales bacterium]|nr:hypothetical protein [Anaerolineales bacterium]
MNIRRAMLAALTVLTAALACVVPGLPSASQPAPTVDTRLEIMVAETVSAALAQTQQSVPTPTLPPTSTSTPTATVSPTPETNSSASSLTKLDDGSTYFADSLVEFEITIPAGWLAVRINQQEYLDAWLLPELANPALQRSLGSIENLDPTELRLFVLDIQEGHTEIDFVTNINFYWDKSSDLSLENDEDLKAEAATLPQALPGLEVTATEISATSLGIPVGSITSKTPVTTLGGVNLEIFQKQVFVKVGEGVLIITLSTTEELKQATLSQFDAAIDTMAVGK